MLDFRCVVTYKVLSEKISTVLENQLQAVHVPEVYTAEKRNTLLEDGNGYLLVSETGPESSLLQNLSRNTRQAMLCAA